MLTQHAGGHAGLHAQVAHATHHGQHGLERGAVADLPPGPTHAEAIRTGLFRGPRPLQHRLHLHLCFESTHVTAVVNRLGAVGAVLLATSGFHAEQGSQLHVVSRIRDAVNVLGLPQQLHQWQFQQGLDVLCRPVVTRLQSHGAIGVRPPKRRERLWKSSSARLRAS